MAEDADTVKTEWGTLNTGELHVEDMQLDGTGLPSEDEARPGSIYVDDEGYLRVKSDSATA